MPFYKYKCTLCGAGLIDQRTIEQRYVSPPCPVCGALMEFVPLTVFAINMGAKKPDAYDDLLEHNKKLEEQGILRKDPSAPEEDFSDLAESDYRELKRKGKL